MARGAQRGQSTLAGLARHAAALSAPPGGVPAQNPELLAQAREIAAEGDPAAFAFLELARAESARTWPTGRRTWCRASGRS